MHMWRVTIRTIYGPNTPGYKDKGARQGHYIRATSEAEARELAVPHLRKKGHKDVRAEDLDVEPWGD